MSYNDLLDVILMLKDDVWSLWGWVITLNVAVIGWLIQRHGLYGWSEKIVATIAYTAFILSMYEAMDDVYKKLDMTTNELYGYDVSYREKSADTANYVPAPKGILKYYISRSPEYCRNIDKSSSCKPYSDDFNVAVIWLTLSWLQNMLLFWCTLIWIIARKLHKKHNKGS